VSRQFLDRSSRCTCCHTFRATGITAYLQNGGTLEKAHQIAPPESPRTTKLYDRSDDTLTLDEIERITLKSGSESGADRPSSARMMSRGPLSAFRNKQHRTDVSFGTVHAAPL
jgi:hypothetical protein